MIYSPRLTTNIFLNGSAAEIHKTLSMEVAPDIRNGYMSPRGSSTSKLSIQSTDRKLNLLSEKIVALSLIQYLMDEQAGRRFRIPQEPEDLKASHLFLSLHSDIEVKSPGNQARRYKTLINNLQLHIEKYINPTLDKLRYPDLPSI